jgi:hypothetical protein
MNRSQRNFLLLLLIVCAAILVVWLTHRTPTEAPTSESTVARRIGPPDIYPITNVTPGAANPEITQDNINETICNPHWSTKSERPPASYTNKLKREGLDQYGYSDRNMRDYEEDHLIPLEIGGNPNDPKNLWPESYDPSIPDGGAHYKDKVENYLHDQVCSGRMPLAQAQQAIATDWYQVYISDIKK